MEVEVLSLKWTGQCWACCEVYGIPKKILLPAARKADGICIQEVLYVLQGACNSPCYVRSVIYNVNVEQ